MLFLNFVDTLMTDMKNMIQNNNKVTEITDNSFGDLQIRMNVGKMLANEAGIKEFSRIDEQFEIIQMKIEEETVDQKQLSINTLKRLAGKIDIERPYNFATTTVNTVCEFLEKDSWDDVIEAAKNWNILKPSESGVTELLGFDENGVFVKGLRKGETFWLKYLPNRILQLAVLGNNQYKVINAAFTVFKPGDILVSPSFRQHKKFRVAEVRRGANSYFDIESAPRHVIIKVARTKLQLDEEENKTSNEEQ